MLIRKVISRLLERANRWLVERRLSRLRRGQRDHCWCGGGLLPFSWHPSYGVCEHCGTFVNRKPPLDLDQLYGSRLYWWMIQRYHGAPSLKNRSSLYRQDGRLDYWLGLIERFCPPQGNVIEVGCAPGILLAELQARGYKCIGVEPDKKTAIWIERNTGVHVIPGLFPDVDLPECDIFLAMDVLEHSAAPDKFMVGAARILTQGGVAIIQTPTERYGYNPPFGEKFKPAFNEYEHLFLFTPRAMVLLAEKAYLEIINDDERLWLFHEVSVFKKTMTHD